MLAPPPSYYLQWLHQQWFPTVYHRLPESFSKGQNQGGVSLINQFSFGLDQKIASMILSMATIPTTVKGWIDQAKIFHAQKMCILALQKGQIAPQAHLPSHSHYDPNAMDVHTVTLSKLTPVEQAKCMKEGQCFRCRMLRSLHNQISSSAHLSVVRRHVEFRSLGSFTSSDEKLARLKSH